MKSVFLGHDQATGARVDIPASAFPTHFHLIGGTGKGKTTALHTILHPIMLDVVQPSCSFVFDRLGNFAEELLLWISSDYCTQDVRDRLVYIEPSREDVVLGFNPLLYDTLAHGYYKVMRATDIILRAWDSQNIEAMPRLARWTFNAFWAVAQLGLTIADCVHLLMPGSDYHSQLLAVLPDRLQAEWSEIASNRHSNEAIRILESSRNRLKPYFESDILRRMFGATQNRLDVARFMREGKIVILNLAPGNRLSPQLSDTIGSLVLNEILATARSLPPESRTPTYLVLDEFQNFVGPDIESALPEVRQLGLRLLLSHQSFSQLKRGDHDLSSMIFQAQSRLIFGVQGEDADLLAEELASITFDNRLVKDENFSRRQLVKGHRKTELSSWSNAESEAQQWRRDYGTNWSANAGSQHQLDDVGHHVTSRGTGSGSSSREGTATGRTTSHTTGSHEQLVPVYDEFEERTNLTYVDFNEQKQLLAKEIRNLPTGRALMRLVNDETLYRVDVKRSTPGHLAWPVAKLATELPEVMANMERLLEKNFSSGLFVTPEVIDQESEERLKNVLQPKILLDPPIEETGVGGKPPNYFG